MSDISDITKKINDWIRLRGWEKHQKPKDLAISLSLEVAEVLEHFQWKSDKEFKKYFVDNKEGVADELADSATYLFKLSDKLGIDLSKAIESKLEKASKKYPVGTARDDSKLTEYYEIKKKYRKNI
jgi:dCTP diphosphatase